MAGIALDKTKFFFGQLHHGLSESKLLDFLQRKRIYPAPDICYLRHSGRAAGGRLSYAFALYHNSATAAQFLWLHGTADLDVSPSVVQVVSVQWIKMYHE